MKGEFPEIVYYPARTEKHCGMCPHHKLIGVLHVRSGPGGYREYSCTHPEAWPETKDPRLARLCGKMSERQEGRHIGKTEETPDWCPLLQGGQKEASNG